MKDDIQLFIGGMPVDLGDNVDVLFNYSVDELTNPTIVRNSYSKTITIEDTPDNSKVFGQFWSLERTQMFEGEPGITYNPSKRVPFELYVNQDIYQSGYAKLMQVVRTGNHNVYDVMLFGGLGSFFYNLAYLNDEQESKRKLSDLHYMASSSTPSEKEFDFVIKKETIKDAWDNINSDESSMWHYINFASSYDGVPDDFDADKVLMNLGTGLTPTSGSTQMQYRPGRRPGTYGQVNLPVTSATTESTYYTYDGYVLAELSKERTADEMREFRSYLMRPVIRAKEVINACCNPENNGGYEVVLDPTFFTSSNPYFEKAWMTLPLLTSLEYNGSEGDDQTGVTVTIGTTTTGGTRNDKLYEEKTEFLIGTITANTYFNFSLDLNLQAIMNALPSGVVSSEPLYPCAYSEQSQVYYPGAVEVQLVAYSQDGRVITVSEVMNCTSGYNQRRTVDRQGRTQITTYMPTPNDFPAYTAATTGSTYSTKTVEFDYVSGSTWDMNTTLSLSLKKVPKNATIKLVVSKVNNSSNNIQYDKAMCLWQRYYDASNRVCYRTPAMVNHFNILVSNVNVSLATTGDSIRTGAKFTKADLLHTDYTPADFLLSYAKMFGLYFQKDKYADVIYIMTRDTFYNKENIKDISDKIDISKEMSITPIVFDAKWYDWSQKIPEGMFAEDYRNTYGYDSGTQRVNTGYNFDASQKDLYKDIVFKGAIECVEKSDMFGFISDDTNTKPWMYDSFTYNLYSPEGLDDSAQIEINSSIKDSSLQRFGKSKFTDLYSKMQFHDESNGPTDGSNVLCFFNGFIKTRTSNTDKPLNYFITDDNAYMAMLNGDNPCWLFTTGETDHNGDQIAIKVTQIPQFTRYMAIPDTGIVQRAWDFGVPRQLYIPGYQIDYNTTIYNNFWQKYIEDLYDIDTRKLTCYVRLDERPAEEWLRDFFWFRNGIWRINKIIDFNVKNNNTTKIEFIKVQDVNNYTNTDIPEIPAVMLVPSTTAVTNVGATVTINVYVADGVDWYVSDTTVMLYNPSQTHGQGNGSFTITIPANEGDSIVHRISVENSYDQWGWCEIVQEEVVFTVTEFANYSHGDVPQTGGTALFNVKSTYPWTVTIDRTYAEIIPDSGTGSTSPGETVELTFGLNTSYAPRNVKMTYTNSIGSQVIVYKWQEGISIFNVERTDGSGDIAQRGASATLKVTSPENPWTATTDSTFVTLVNDTGNTTAQMEVVFDENTGSSRTATIVVTNDLGNTVTYTLTQAGNAVPVNPISPQYIEFDATGGTATITNTIPGQWEIVARPGWCICMPISGNTGTNITVIVNQPNPGSARSDSIVVWDRTSGQTYIITVTQKAATDVLLVVGPTSINFDTTGGTATFTITTNVDWDIQ